MRRLFVICRCNHLGALHHNDGGCGACPCPELRPDSAQYPVGQVFTE